MSVELPGRQRRIPQTPYRNVVEVARNSVGDVAADLGTPTVAALAPWSEETAVPRRPALRKMIIEE